MLKTNTKKASENVQNYIISKFNPENYDSKIEDFETFEEVASFIFNCFYNEMVKHDKRRKTEYEFFVEWCQGLPSILDTCYYYNRSAIEDLGNILEETEEEKNRFTETQAEEKLTYLIYRELKKTSKK